jgi:hypothetical protein
LRADAFWKLRNFLRNLANFRACLQRSASPSDQRMPARSANEITVWARSQGIEQPQEVPGHDESAYVAGLPGPRSPKLSAKLMFSPPRRIFRRSPSGRGFVSLTGMRPAACRRPMSLPAICGWHLHAAAPSQLLAGSLNPPKRKTPRLHATHDLDLLPMCRRAGSPRGRLWRRLADRYRDSTEQFVAIEAQAA